jgi:hypothetical protein
VQLTGWASARLAPQVITRALRAAPPAPNARLANTKIKAVNANALVAQPTPTRYREKLRVPTARSHVFLQCVRAHVTFRCNPPSFDYACGSCRPHHMAPWTDSSTDCLALHGECWTLNRTPRYVSHTSWYFYYRRLTYFLIFFYTVITYFLIIELLSLGINQLRWSFSSKQVDCTVTSAVIRPKEDAVDRTDYILSDKIVFYLLDTFRRICCFQLHVGITVTVYQIVILRSFLSHRDTLIVSITLWYFDHLNIKYWLHLR